MTAEYLLDRRKRGFEGRIVEPALSEYWRIACGYQEHIALAQRDVEAFAEMQHHLARGLRLARFQKAQVSCRNLGIERQTELRHAPALAPFADAVPDVAGQGGGVLHGCSVACRKRSPMTSEVIDCPRASVENRLNRAHRLG